MKISLAFLTSLLCSFLIVTPAHAQDDYQKHFKSYIQTVEYAFDQEGCVKNTKSRLKYKIDFANRFNEKSRIPKFMIEKWVEKGPDEAEKNAAARVIEICNMSLQELRDLARNYDYGRNGFVQNKEIAISLYYYMYNAHEDIGALYRLKDLGANVVTEPPTKEEKEALVKELEELEKEIERRQIDTDEMEDFLMDHILVFPFSP